MNILQISRFFAHSLRFQSVMCWKTSGTLNPGKAVTWPGIGSQQQRQTNENASHLIFDMARVFILNEHLVHKVCIKPATGDFMIISATDLRRRSFTFVSLTSRINASHTTSTNSKSNAESLSHFCSSSLFSNIYEYSTLVVALYASRQRIFQRDSVSSGTRSRTLL